MRQIEIMRLLLLLFIFITLSVHPIFAQKQTLRISTFLAYHSEYFLGIKNDSDHLTKVVQNLI